MATFVSRIRYQLLRLATVQLPRELSIVAPVSMPREKEPQRVLPSSLGDDTRGGLQRMNRRGLWAAGVVLLLVGLVGVLAIGTGYAKDETEAAKCSEATLDGTYLFAQNGVEIKGDEQRPFALAGYEVFDGQGKLKALFTLNINTKKVIGNETISGTYSVEADCTSTATYADGTRSDQFIAPDGSELTFVGTQPKRLVTASFEPRGSAKRVGE